MIEKLRQAEQEFEASTIGGDGVPRHRIRKLKVTISGSLNKDVEAVRRAIRWLRSKGIRVLSPPSGEVDSYDAGFAHLDGDRSREKKFVEDDHLNAIRRSDFLWIASPAGYLGLSTAFELGFAEALGVPTYAPKDLDEDPLNEYAMVVDGLDEAVQRTLTSRWRKRQSLPARDALAAARRTQRNTGDMIDILEGRSEPLRRDHAQRLRALVADCARNLQVISR